MKKLRSIKIMVLLSFFVLFSFQACQFMELDMTESPNSLSADKADLKFMMNNMQLDLVDFYHESGAFGMELTRMVNMFGSVYSSAYAPVSFNDMWWYAYSAFLADANVTIPEYEANEWFIHSGAAKVMKAYVLATLVDNFGDVPFSESFDPTNFNPAVDKQDVLYAQAYAMLDDAILDFAKVAKIEFSTDLFYGGDVDSWTRLANTLKLKMALNTGDAAAVAALVADNNLISVESDEFVFTYSTVADNPDSRHPYFRNNYLNGANDYMSNYFMWCMFTEKGTTDPRMRYYFYRQSTSISSDNNELPCITATKPSHYSATDVFCHASNGYWGRDHLDNAGIPPDNGLRTIYGLYPAGGKFDDNADRQAKSSDGAQGAGIAPIMLSSYVDFMLAEAVLTMSTTGDARSLLLSGVQKSLDRVTNFHSEAVDATFAASSTDISDYITEVGNLYDAATSDAERLEVVAKEYYIALFGNGVEVYNLVRRTTFPLNLQPALSSAPGDFWRSLYYPANSVNINSNMTQKASPSVQVFWDNNPAGVIK